jgi:hypothetical protein
VRASDPRYPAWIVPASAVSLTILLFIVIGDLGYNPTDDGNILAQSHRILNGEAPHRDVIFARPMGSALLHVLDFAIPLPLFEASRLIGIAEIVAYSFLFAWVILGIPLTEWRAPHLAGAVGSTLINMHTFPLMGWYTTDGLLFVALGLALLVSGLSRDRAGRIALGMVALGIAPLMKQSFAIAPLLGMALVALRLSTSRRPAVAGALRAGGLAALPLVCYTVAMAALGAADEFVAQVVGAEPVWGGSFIRVFHAPTSGVRPLLLIVAVAVTLIALRWSRTIESDRVNPGPLSLTLPVLITALVLALPLTENFAYRGDWAVAATWSLIALILIRLVVDRSLDRTAVVVVAAAWMVSLSWGYDVPNLVGGTVLLALLERVWRGTHLEARLIRIGTAALTLIAMTVVAVGFLDARRERPYYDRSEPELSASIRDVSPEFGRIRTNPVTAAYLGDIAACIERFPASKVAVLPDNPGIYPALGLRNPFPIDWMYPNEVEEVRGRIIGSARRLDDRGDYLVLFQTFSAFRLVALDRIDPAEPDAEPFFYGSDLGRRIVESLTGERIACGSFVGVYRAGSH